MSMKPRPLPLDVEPDSGPRIAHTTEVLAADVLLERALDVEARAAKRRSVRHFSRQPVPRAVVESLIRTASSAPSGANMQPWTFVAVAAADLKRQIRAAAETEERQTYASRMSDEWRDALHHIGTNWRKPFLEDAPWLVIVFVQRHGIAPDGSKIRHYYAKESVGIAAGTFIAAAHELGLATLTHTPSPMAFLSKLLGRPSNESAFLLMPLGWPTDDCSVPDLQRKSLDQIAQVFVDGDQP